jgi:4-hydroxybenzoate polyprenyltransferase
VAFCMLAVSLLAALLVDLAFAAALAGYAVLNFGYSVWLRKIAFVDTFVIAVLFSMRLLMGAVLIGQGPPVWLLAFSMFLFFSLALAKRHAELIDPDPTLDAAIATRGYRRNQAHTTLPLGVVTAAAAVAVAAIYLLEDVFRKVPYAQPEFLWFPVLSVAIFAARIWLVTVRGRLHGDPVSFALRDPGCLLAGGFGALGFLLAL